MWINLDTVILFDSLHGKSMLEKEPLRQILLKCFYGLKNVKFRCCTKQTIQENDALTCAEHVIYFILFENIFYLKNGYFELNYCRKLFNYCRKQKITPDEFVWNEIYIHFN